MKVYILFRKLNSQILYCSSDLGIPEQKVLTGRDYIKIWLNSQSHVKCHMVETLWSDKSEQLLSTQSFVRTKSLMFPQAFIVFEF